jgi:NAD(P)-dependent dehydrogenase (short-subunit alcohol dehydrogenase family)
MLNVDQPAGRAPEPMRALADRRVVITGAARGIGRAVSRACAEAGAQLVMIDRRDELLAEVAADLRRDHVAVDTFVCDVADQDAVERAIDVAAASGPIHGLINNAANIPAARSFETISADEWDETMRVNARGPFVVTRAVVPHLRAAGGGAIVMIASRQFFLAPEGQCDYVASKGALIGMARVMARELGPDGIRVNCVAPGMLLTPGVMEVLPDALQRSRTLTPPLGRQQTEGDFTGSIVYLLSDAAAFMTGQTMIVDGGMYMH